MENPYQPPHEVELPATTALRPGLYSLTRLANLCLRLYLATTAYYLLEHVYATFVVTRAEPALHDSIYLTPSVVVANLVGAASLASIVLYLVWKYRAAVNARVLDPNAMTVSPGWAVGGYFVPIVNIFLPCAAMAGIARASKVERFWVAMWWAAHLGGVLLAIVIVVMSIRIDAGEMAELPTPLWLEHLSAAWAVLTCFFSWQVVMRITRAQMAPASQVEEAIPA